MRTRLTALVNELREAGIPVSVAESIDARRAVAVAGVERVVLREALAASVVKDEGDRAVFDAAFERHFPLPVPPASAPRRRRRGARAAGGTALEGRGRGHGGERAVLPGAGAATSARRPEPATHERAAAAGAAARPGAPAGTRRMRRTRLDELRRRPFRELTMGEVRELTELMRVFADALRRRLARRWRTARRGAIDLRRTLRAATAHGGVPVRLARRRRTPARPDLVALCDVSGSVAAASELLLALVAPAADFFRHVALYAYVDRLCPVTVEHGRLVPDGTLDLHARSDFGRVLQELRTARPRLAPTTLVLVLGDARNNRRPPRADLLRAIRAQVQRLVWIVPEPRARWGTGDSALPAYVAACDDVLECVDVDGLVAAVRRTLP